MTRPAQLVSIGAFARATRLTVKALRHYHAERLIEPTWIDPATSYRYYSWHQIGDAVRISMLRQLEVPVATIREHLSGRLSTEEMVARERRRRTADIEAATHALAGLGIYADIELEGRCKMDEVEFDESVTLMWSGTIRADAMDDDVTDRIARLLALAARIGVDPSPPVWGQFPVDVEDPLNFSAHLPLTSRTLESTLPDDQFSIGFLDAGKYLRAVHRGSVATLPFTYSSFLQCLEQRTSSNDRPIYERYLTDPSITNTAANVVELLYRVA